ncbi:MAG: NUDIX domain-containing protein, partial [Verrucomicrobiota bacterium]
ADQVIAYFKRFMKAFPSVKALAEAPRQEVLKLWEGLGYYARARKLHDTARLIHEEREGRFPQTYEDWLALPGVGPYTAAAVTSLALNLDHAVVDGNVIRVLSRWMAWDGDPKSTAGKKLMQAWADELLTRGRAGLFNEGMMELGATVCLPRNPDCASCPMQKVCKAFEVGRVADFPRRPAKKKIPHKIVGAAVVVDAKKRILIAQRREESMLGGLWEFPGGTVEPGESLPQCIARELKEELGIEVEVGEELIEVKHAYSHFSITLHVHWAKIRRGRPKVIECADFKWVKKSELRQYPFSRADVYVVDRLLG